MGTAVATNRAYGTLPIILIAAVVQGGLLYALHLSIDRDFWPATSPGVVGGLYAIAVFVPLTLQLLAAHARERVLWILLAALAVAYFYFGWHYGAHVAGDPKDAVRRDDWIPAAFEMVLLWLIALPFGQMRLSSGHWRAPYEGFFGVAWRNKVLLAEAVAFTGLFWLLLFLWQELFHSLGFDFFRELFSEPIFVYPVTSLVFGGALHLIGSVERMTRVVIEQVLSVLKWLALLAGLILALFSIALLLKLPHLVMTGERIIGAAWLLWLVAVTVLLVNAAYRDGSVFQPYPRWIGLALRAVVPLTILIALTAAYALILRVASYGFTVERVWAFVVAGAALAYSIGYGIAAFNRTSWMGGISRVNVVVALGMIVTLSLTLTPILSPYRIAANSQYEIILSQERAGESDGTTAISRHDSPGYYLRYRAGRYGSQRLEALTKLEDHPRAAQIREEAQFALQMGQPPAPVSPSQVDQKLDGLVMYPQGAELEAPLRERLRADLLRQELESFFAYRRKQQWGGLLVDLNGDDTQEFVLLFSDYGIVYQEAQEGWRPVGKLVPQTAEPEEEQTQALVRGEVGTIMPAWRELKVGTSVYRVRPEVQWP
ncbi:MAG TPA: hypothetical protein VF193_06245 [Steroidobacter sp.]